MDVKEQHMSYSEKDKLKKQADDKNITVRELCKQAKAACNGNEFRAAMSLGVYPNTIRYHLNKPEPTTQEQTA